MLDFQKSKLQENWLTVYIPIDLEVPYNHLCKEKNLVIIPQVGVGKVIDTSSDETTFTETEYFSIDNKFFNELDGLPPTDYMLLLRQKSHSSFHLIDVDSSLPIRMILCQEDDISMLSKSQNIPSFVWKIL